MLLGSSLAVLAGGDTICQPISVINRGLSSPTPFGRADVTMRTIVYADGGCDPNPGPGGWGVVVAAPEGTVELCGGEPGNTTNNRMELTAAIKGLEHFPAGAAIEMRCDSQYVVKSVTEWMRGWKAKGWRTTTGDVKNVDLMKRLDELNAVRDVKWTWVRGHAGDRLNERADALVHRGRREAKFGKLESRNDTMPAAAATAVPASPSQGADLRVDLALGLQITRAAKAAGITPDALVDDAIRLYLALGPSEIARLRASRA
jgi:ribonuclease HI